MSLSEIARIITGDALEWPGVFWLASSIIQSEEKGLNLMEPKPSLRRCAVYTRKSSEEGLEQGFNSLDAQREAGVGVHSEPSTGRLEARRDRV